MSSFKGKVVIVTGASSGIGAAIAIHLAKLNASLVLCGRNAKNLEATAKLCLFSQDIPQPLIVIADMKDEEAVKSIVSKTIQHFGKLDVLINNAGAACYGNLQNMDLEKYDETMIVNVRSVVVLTHEALPHLKASKGNIVNISSVGGLRAFNGALSYCMSKAALDHFTKCVALEVASDGVRVNSVNPGLILSNFQRRGGMSEDKYEKYIESAKHSHALGRVGRPEEVAEVAVFLASDGASFMTGILCPVEGGKLLMSP